MRRLLLSSLVGSALLVPFVLALGHATPLHADDGEQAARVSAASAEVWRFRKGDAQRTVDVTGLPEIVREALLARMAVDGYLRDDAVPASSPGRDLKADAQELVLHGGRFSGQGGARAEGGAATHSSGGEPAAHQGVLLGALVRLESGGEAAWLRILGAPAGSLARAIGLGRGDRILALDGEVPTLAGLARCRDVELAPGQLAVRALRREGRIEEWTLTFARGAAPRSR